jgi:hypothetical protein
MTAKYPGKCAICEAHFPAGTEIVYNGRANHAACLESERAAIAMQDAEDNARFAKDAEAYKAGLHIRSIPGDKEIMVEGAPSYEMARAEAFAAAASIRAAGGKADILRHKGRDGKWHTGRTVVRYYGMSNLGHHEGWAFRWRVETAEAAP